MITSAKDVQLALGISEDAAKLYLAALEESPAALTQLSRRTQISRTVIHRPLNELLDLGLLLKEPVGKRLHYHPIGPQDWPLIMDRRRQMAAKLSFSLLRQISIPGGDVQMKWRSGIAGIETALREFFAKSKGKFSANLRTPKRSITLGMPLATSPSKSE
ncbi:hypothetical protein HY504_02990 [Candidatus Wolfebacteria bacterium]|nr:hypothetical protein [Candidatus Wolfebacteria bacterium]